LYNQLIWKKYHFRPPKEVEEFLGPEVPYLSMFGALTYIANCIWLDIIFSVKLLVSNSSAPTRKHWNVIKPVSLKFFYIHELQEKSDIDIRQIWSSDNLTDLFTKVLPTSTFKKLVHKIGMYCLRDVTCWKWSLSHQGEFFLKGRLFVHCTLFSFPLDFSGRVLMSIHCD